MRIVNFGSLNYDYVYSVDHIVLPGETISSTDLSVFCGGKGLNQSIALARAGAEVYHAGLIGDDGDTLVELCRSQGVLTEFIRKTDERTDNAIIQVSKSGENSIVLFGGANRKNTVEFIDEVLSFFEEGDYVLLQNEMNLTDYIIEQAYAKNMHIVLNPSPFNESLAKCDFGKVSVFILNEIEGMEITSQKDKDKILQTMLLKYPDAQIVLTLGRRGVVCADFANIEKHGIFDVRVVDTTAAGDTFTGYFLASVLAQKTVEEALRLASIASSLAVSRKGAADSIPDMTEVMNAHLTICEQ